MQQKQTQVAESPWLCNDYLGCPSLNCIIPVGADMVSVLDGAIVRRYHVPCHERMEAGITLLAPAWTRRHGRKGEATNV